MVVEAKRIIQKGAFSLSLPILEKDFSDLSWIKRSNGGQDIAEGTISLINTCLEKEIDTIFFLDRSARPAYVLFRHTWKNLLPNVPLPQIRFINIGTNNVFQEETNAKLYTEKLNKRYSSFNKSGNIIVADEFVCSGHTLSRAKEIVKQVFPYANVMQLGIYRSTPPWKEEIESLSGLGEKDSDNPLESFFSYKKSGPTKTEMAFRKELINFSKIISQKAIPLRRLEVPSPKFQYN